MQYVSGSVTPYTDHNPTVTIYYMDPETFEIINYDHYYNNIDNQDPGEITWLYIHKY